jgi:8-amino-7-oxononanoate synthase
MTAGLREGDDSSNAVTKAVIELVRRVLPKGLSPDISLDTPLDELGLDSLARLEILGAVEQEFKMRFLEESLFQIETCRDLVEYIQTAVNHRSTAGSSVAAVGAPAPDGPPAPREIPPPQHDLAQFPECTAFRQRFQTMAAAGLENPFFRTKQGVARTTATIAGREVVSYTSFDYLGMARSPRVMAAAKEAIERFGTSASASRLVGGNNVILEELDEELARFLGTEAAVAFPSGFGTNESVLGHLFGPQDLILYDELAHTSIVQGSLLSRAQRRPFPHNDFAFVDSLLRDVREKYRRVVLAVEGVYSMDGDYPDLPRFLEVKKRHRALLYVDEAHSIGVMGATGRGICEHYGVSPAEGDFWMGTISKALGSGGGYLAGPKILIEYLKYTTPAFVFATALSPANAAAALAAVRLLQEEPDRVTRLRSRIRLFLDLARECGLNTGSSRETPVIPVILGDSVRCVQVSSALLLEGVDVQPILYPAVPESASRLRFFITAEHTEEQIRRTVKLLAEGGCRAAQSVA